MRPSIGRIVILAPGDSPGLPFEPAPAVITKVLADDLVNLTVLADGAHPYPLGTPAYLYETRAKAEASRIRPVCYWPERV